MMDGNELKLTRLNSIANNALRDTIRTPELTGFDPLSLFKVDQTITVDLLTGKLTPDMEGDDVEVYYSTMSKWFHHALKKEGIPVDIIDKAVLHISPEGKKCVITADGKTFTSK